MNNQILNVKDFLLNNSVIFNSVIAFVLIVLICLTMLNKKQLKFFKEYQTINLTTDTLKSVIPNLIFSIIITTVFAFAIGYRFNIVTSGSMRPSIEPGAVVIVKKVPFEKLDIGDVITFSYSGTEQVTHQIIAIRKDNIGFQLGEQITYNFNGEDYTFEIGESAVGKTIITHGTANSINSIDSAISYQNVRGKVFYNIWYVGLIVFTIRTQLFAFLIVALAIIVSYSCYLKYPTYNYE